MERLGFIGIIIEDRSSAKAVNDILSAFGEIIRGRMGVPDHQTGDAVIGVGDAKMGGLSTYASLFILNSFLIDGARKAEARGVKPPSYASGNVDGGTAKNVALEERFFGRVRNL